MKKKLLLCALLSLYSLNVSNYVFAAPKKNAKTEDESDFKFGPKVAQCAFGDYGAFFEYKLHDILGLQSGLYYTKNFMLFMPIKNSNSMKGAFVKTSCVSLPLVLRLYPGEDKQFCFYGGPRLGIRTGGTMYRSPKLPGKKTDFRKDPSVMDGFKTDGLNEEELNDDPADKLEVSRLEVGIQAGFDYECIGGIIWGFVYDYRAKGFVNYEDTDKWIEGTFRFNLGWNLVPLFFK